MDKLPEEMTFQVLMYAGAIVPKEEGRKLGEEVVKKSQEGPNDRFSHYKKSMEERWSRARAINASLALVCKSWNLLFTPYLYSTFFAASMRSSQDFLRTLESRKDYAHHIRQIILGRPVGEIEIWSPNYPNIVEDIVDRCPELVSLIVVYRDDLMYEERDYILPLSSISLSQRIHRTWTHIRFLTASNLLWESFAAYIMAIAESWKLEFLHFDLVDGRRADVGNAHQFIRGRRVLSGLRTLSLTRADPTCLHLLQSFQFPYLRSFTFQSNTALPTDVELGTFIWTVFYGLEYLSLPYGVMQGDPVTYPIVPYPRLETLVLTASPHSDFKAPKFPRIPLHSIQTLRLGGAHDARRAGGVEELGAWLTGMCDIRQMPQLRRLQTDIHMEQTDLLKSHLAMLEETMKQHDVTLQVLDASGDNFENLSASL